MIKSMDLVSILGPMAENTLVSGKMDSSTDKVYIRISMELRGQAFGKKVKE